MCRVPNLLGTYARDKLAMGLFHDSQGSVIHLLLINISKVLGALTKKMENLTTKEALTICLNAVHLGLIVENQD